MTLCVSSQIFQTIVEILAANDINTWVASRQFFDIIEQSLSKFFKSTGMTVTSKY